ncbi:hypothetical protein TD95_003805 [Thielaviopsis punctulata]|uniref:Zn(2)-C6 fungal-type domain-containing protein n=1 Tax=Thielaviopsis punctulata TaxID=72032 RepID=A0A0F4ZCR0_9PEZI|nr:hypothetical protein TD95_003805 [Thielaviopsis punctulata]
MLSNPLQRYSAYHSATDIQSSISSGLQSMDGLSSSSQYPLSQLQHQPELPRSQLNDQASNVPRMAIPQPKNRQQSSKSARAATAGAPIRRRISRACDQCNQLRTKCDGQHPCAHCIEFGLTCEYIRERKKRGKVSRKDLAAQQAAAQASGGRSQEQLKSPRSSAGSNSPPSGNDHRPATSRSIRASRRVHESRRNSESVVQTTIPEDSIRLQQHSAFEAIPELSPHSQLATQSMMDRDLGSSAISLGQYSATVDPYDRQTMGVSMINESPFGAPQPQLSAYTDLPYGLQSSSSATYGTSPFHMRTNSLPEYIGAGSTSPTWMPISSPPAQSQFQSTQMQPPPPPVFPAPQQNALRYPVLKPLLPHIVNLMPPSVACDLMDVYFASSSSALIHPMSPYVLGYVFRKRSFLHSTKPRPCQPALLASMLWVAAQTSDAQLLTSVPSARGKICQKLLELTVNLLKPLIHTTGDTAGNGPTMDGVAAALGSLGVALPGSISMDALSGESGAFGAAGSVDDVVTYIHLATVVSASEYKGASLRWWTAAWSLARELKLGRELPPLSHVSRPETDADGDTDMNPAAMRAEEEREERRRIWWLVYIVDRHLALCYNRPLFLLDRECDGLLRPMDDIAWQNGDFKPYVSPTTDPSLLAMSDVNMQSAVSRRGPSYECTSHSIFGFFLPLMTVLGEVVDLHHMRNHPRFGVAFRSSQECEKHVTEISRHLEIYERSLAKFEKKHISSDEKSDQANASGLDNNNTNDSSGPADPNTPSVHSVHTSTSSTRMTESDIQTHIVLAYGTHVMHVLHILLADKWDPLNLLDDNDLWISTQGFITTTAHAVSAAEAISKILEYDPGLEFMPFFFGIYLLQGSFLLLLIADKLQLEASQSVVKACETIIRAHEACVVTLNTEYQRNFSKVMRSALAQIRGRIPADLNEQHQRRREVLSLYRWAGDGTGLAL